MTGIESQKTIYWQNNGVKKYVNENKLKNTSNDKENIPRKFLVLIYRRNNIDMIKD